MSRFWTWTAQRLNPFLQCMAVLSSQTHQGKSEYFGAFQNLTVFDSMFILKSQ